ncbi:MAG: N-acetylmuramoyl-L-alanine amidase [Clostridiales bacterium]|nr:N-acetylmuramoyl-L-alanine amidase [Clostridiales bacterium]
MKKKLELVMGICLILAAFLLARQGAVLVQSDDATENPSRNASKDNICIVVDAGHGGSDPGKVGVNGALEKDINLSLALRLQELLEKEKITVILTRNSDAGLYAKSATNKKVDDMQNRCKIIMDANPVFTVSLHQNSYPSPDVKGAQVFYYGQSKNGKELAEILQESLISHVDPNNTRAAKANESYYLLKKTPTPTVIVECGFLSNPTEADLLLDSDYQDKLVRAIYLGIFSYLEKEDLL